MGLIIGELLSDENIPVNIFEKDSSVGGLCKTINYKSYLLDIGPHIFHTPNEELSNYWENKFTNLFSFGDFRSAIYKNGEYIEYPLSIESIKELKDKKISRLILREIENIKSNNLNKINAGKNYKEYLDNHIGSTLRKLFYEKYPEKLWGISTDKMTADWAPKRINIYENKGSFYRNQWVAVGKNGAGSIYNKIADNIINNGGNIHFKKELTAINHQNYQISELLFSDCSKIKITSDDIVISTIPLSILCSYLGHKVELKFRHVRIVYLFLSLARCLRPPYSWVYFDSDDTVFTRISEPTNLSSSLSQNKNTFLTIEIPYSDNDEIDLLTNYEIENLCKNQLISLNFFKESDFIESISTRAKYVYPVQDSGYQHRSTTAKAFINKFHQLISLGTGGDFNYADSQILFEMGKDSAQHIKERFFKNKSNNLKNKFIKFKSVINFSKFKISNTSNPFIIAEAGINHNGNVKLALELIDNAIIAGVHAIKFQTYEIDSRISRNVKSANYAELAEGMQESLPQILNNCSLSFSDFETIFDYARKNNIEAFSTPFDLRSARFLNDINVSIFKIASSDLVNKELIQEVASYGKPIILSTGMSTISEIYEALEWVKEIGNESVILMQCTSSYPAADIELNLNAIKSLSNIFQVPVGFSDHSNGTLASKIAISLGANVIERHFTIDKNMSGPDHILSSNVLEFKELVNDSVRIRNMLGDGVKKIEPGEYISINQHKKSLYASVDIHPGTLITRDLIAIMGPYDEIDVKNLSIIVGRFSKKFIKKYTPIKWSDV